MLGEMMYEEDFLKIVRGTGWWMDLNMGCLNGRRTISMRCCCLSLKFGEDFPLTSSQKPVLR